MIIAETTLSIPADILIHPVMGRIFLLPPQVIRDLYNGNNQDLYVSQRRDLVPLTLGIMAMNLVAAKYLGKSYPRDLIDPVLWRPGLISTVKDLVFKTGNGIEASLSTLEPSNFIYLRVSAIPAENPLLKVLFQPDISISTIKVQVT